MKLVFSVNQREALRLGVDAPHSTVVIDIDPASLSEEERVFLAERVGTDAKIDSRFSIVYPTLEGVRDAISEKLLSLEVARVEKEAQTRARIEQCLAGRFFYSSDERLECPSDLVEAWHILIREVREKENQEREDRAAREEAARKARIEKEARVKAENEAIRNELFARLTAEFRERREAGYASLSEENVAICDLLLSDVGVTERSEEFMSSPKAVSSLTDAEWQALKALRVKYPTAEIDAFQVFDWRDPEEDDEVDEGGYYRFNYRKVARIRVERGRYSAERFVLLA